MQQAELIKRIKELKIKRNAVILAHYYSRPEVQDIADFVGDSLGLSQEAVRQTADVIVFCFGYRYAVHLIAIRNVADMFKGFS